MKVITIMQPWATLVVIGAKKIETRSWNTKYRGPLLIHASKNRRGIGRQLAYSDPFIEVLEKEYKHLLKNGKFDYDVLPHGEIIGQVQLINVTETDFYIDCSQSIPLETGKPYSEKAWQKELAFGDYGPGRFGWLLKNPIKFDNPTPAKGQLGLWEYDAKVLEVV